MVSFSGRIVNIGIECIILYERSSLLTSQESWHSFQYRKSLSRYSNSYFDDKTVSYIDILVQDCSNSIANALELLQSCTKPYHSTQGFPL